ncbi:MAG: hypothetical protein H7836_08565 [Magnetococcus sp. YQC-3]
MSEPSQTKVEIPTMEEDAVITVAAMSDPDNLPLTDVELGQFKRQAVHSRKPTPTPLMTGRTGVNEGAAFRHVAGK